MFSKTLLTAAAFSFALLPSGGVSALSISGMITAEGGGGLLGVEVRILDTGGSTFNLTTTDASGTYVFSDLSAGTYVLWTRNEQGFVDELYDDIPCAGGCYWFAGTPVSISAGNDASGIDFILSAGGRISGTVSASAGGAPLTDIEVRVYNDAGDSMTIGTTSASGEFLSPTGLPAGDYFVRTSNSLGYLDEIWDDQECTGACDPTMGDPVSVSLGSTTSGIDFALDGGGRIAGRVSSTGDGAPIDHVRIEVYNAAGTWITSATPDAAGTYFTNAGLTPGNYFARTENWWGHVDELYDDIPCFAGCDPSSGTPIVVGNTTTPDINFDLDPGGWITGVITDGGTGLPIESAGVEVYTADGRRVTTAFPNASGVYWASGLPTGTYVLRAYSWENYLAELYDNLPCPDGCDLTAGTMVAVVQPDITSGIDFSLDGGASIRGDLSEAGSGAAITEADIQIFDDTGMPVIEVYADQFGAFDSGPIPTGQYYLLVDAWNETLVDEIFDDIPCADFCDPELGELIILSPGETRDLSISLSPGGSMSGSVVSETGASSIDCDLHVFDDQGTLVGVAFSDDSGAFSVSGLPGGSYFVFTHNYDNLIDELWDEIECIGDCDPTSGSEIAVSPVSPVVGINFVLSSALLFSDGFESGNISAW